MNSIQYFFNSEGFDSLNNLVRWNGVKRNKDESVAHHSFLVTFFANLLSEEVFVISPQNQEVAIAILDFKLWVLKSALVHDFPECYSGDILHSVKYNSFNGDEIRTAFQSFVVQSIMGEFGASENPAIDDFTTTLLSVETSPTSASKAINAFVKVADWLACAFYVVKEIDLGNKNFEKYRTACQTKFRASVEKAVLVIEEYEVELPYKIFNKDIFYTLLEMEI